MLLIALMNLLGCTDGGADGKPDEIEETGQPELVDEDGDGILAEQDCDDQDAGVGAAVTAYQDADADGFGDPNTPVESCGGEDNLVPDATDCDDGDDAVHPGAEERCGGGDEDCDGLTDTEDDSLVDGWLAYPDADADGWGDPDGAALSCGGDGVVDINGDCNDEDDSVNPDAEEICDDQDNDCDALVDDADEDLVGADLWYQDGDGDGIGDSGAPTEACRLPEDHAAAGGDCDDADPYSYPGADEQCGDGVDQDCDGSDPVCDEDGDGYEAALDCDDADDSVHPGAAETADGVDQDCDGLIDEGTDAYDDDGDGYSEDEGDCDDADDGVYEGADEICGDGIDQDCDDEDLLCDADGDGSPDGEDCDDDDDTIFPGAEETYDGVDEDCDDVVDDGVYPLDCAEILEIYPSAASGTYTIDMDSDGGSSPFDASCQMTMDGGGWTLATSTVVAYLDATVTREYLYSYGSAWYISPETTLVWDWSSYQPLNGTYGYSSGSTSVEGSFDCSHAESGHWGVGCSNGGGGTYKVLPIYASDAAAGTSTICQDQPDVFGVGACRSDASIWVRDR